MDLTQPGNFLPHRKYGLVGIIFLGMALGLLYVFLVPPWQHYDEPGHFEYAWLMANDRESLATSGYNQRMRREVAASMLEHNFFQEIDFRPNLLSQTEPVWIGISQVGDQPLYYWLLSWPLRLFRFTSVTTQLYIARITSLLFFPVVLLAAWGIMKELIPTKRSHLIWLVPLTITLIPGVVDTMSSVNNDVGAAAFFSVFLWGGVRLLRHRIEIPVLVTTAGAVVASYFTKSTVWLVVPLFLIVVIVILFPARLRWIPAVGTAAAVLLGLLAVFGSGNAAAWVVPGFAQDPTRQETASDTGRGYALHLKLRPVRPAQTLLQSFSPATRTQIKGRTVHVSGRLWASDAVLVEIGLDSGSGWVKREALQASRQKQEFFSEIKIPADATNVWFEIITRAEGKLDEEVSVYLDRLELRVAAEAGEPPDPGRASQAGNLLANPSGEREWLRLRQWVYPSVDYTFYTNLNYVIYSLSNLPATNWYYRITLNNLVETFWSRLGWGNVALPLATAYPVLWGVGVWGLLGAVYGLYVYRQHLPWPVILLLLMAAFFLWAQAWLRGIGSLFGPIWIPSARYALPAIIPTVLGLCAGWSATLNKVSRGHPNRQFFLWYLFIAFFAGLNALAVLSIFEYFYV